VPRKCGLQLGEIEQPLLSLSDKADEANRHADQIHLSLFTAGYMPVQRSNGTLSVTHSRRERNDYEYFDMPLTVFGDPVTSLYYDTLTNVRQT
jgi:hypothetical protein